MSVAERMEKAIEATKRDWAKIRTGIATPAVLDEVMIDYYGAPTPIQHVANITVPEPRVLMIVPWEKPMLEAIEKAILMANLGFNPQNDGENIRITMPALTSERRAELAKQVRKISEDGKVAIRNIRRDENEKLKKEAKEVNMSEDDLKDELADIQKDTDSFIAKLDKLCEEKEADVLKV